MEERSRGGIQRNSTTINCRNLHQQLKGGETPDALVGAVDKRTKEMSLSHKECARNANNSGKGEFIMPPWNISLVCLGMECKFESIAIPTDVPTGQLTGQPFPKHVPAATALSLLTQIAGLTSIAQTRSLEARDVLVNMQHHHEKVVKVKDEEINCLRGQIVQLERQRYGPLLVENEMQAGNQEVHAKESHKTENMPQKVDETLCNKYFMQGQENTNIMDFNIAMATNVKKEVVGSPTGFTSNSEEETDTDDSWYDRKVVANKKFSKCLNDEKQFGMEDGALKRKFGSLSEGPMNIIYGMAKHTRSC